jgi:hypothetical protein
MTVVGEQLETDSFWENNLISIVSFIPKPSDKKRSDIVYTEIRTELFERPGRGKLRSTPLFFQTRYYKRNHEH